VVEDCDRGSNSSASFAASGGRYATNQATFSRSTRQIMRHVSPVARGAIGEANRDLVARGLAPLGCTRWVRASWSDAAGGVVAAQGGAARARRRRHRLHHGPQAKSAASNSVSTASNKALQSIDHVLPAPGDRRAAGR
jgi:hypothetical protein